MAKRVMGLDAETGDWYEYTHTRHHRKSEARLIPWTDGPQTKWQKFKRAAVG